MRTVWTGCMAISLVVVVGVVPASFAQDSPAADQGKPAGTGNEAQERQTPEELSDVPGSKKWEHMGAFVAEPIGRFRVGPEFVDGESIYVIRTPVSQSITAVEVSTTPFEPAEVAGLISNPEAHPAGW